MPKESQATAALKLAIAAGAETWVDDAGVPFITVKVGDHVEHYRLKADPESQPGRWLARIFYKKTRQALPSGPKKDVLENLIADAISGDRVFPTGRRVARVANHVYLDLCNPTWEVVEVTTKGWAIRSAAEVPIRFTRTTSMLALPSPVRGGRVDDLAPFFNCQTEDDFRLVVIWVVAALSAGREYPVLVFVGEAGSAKSTATLIARSIIDPNTAPLRKAPREERDLFIAANNSFVLTFDNLSAPPDWLPDALCAVALDAGYACRALYTDDVETVFRVAAPIILNGISEQLTRSDLADRALSVTLLRVDPTKMKPKDELQAEFNAALPGILGAFLDVLAAALAQLPKVNLTHYPRLAQTAKLMAAAEPALQWVPGTSARLFNLAQTSVAENVTEGDPLVQALLELSGKLNPWKFEGSATELMAKLATVEPHPIPPVWPPTARALGQKLRRIAPQLRLTGWDVNPDGRSGTHANSRCIRLAYPAEIAYVPPTQTFSETTSSAPEPAPGPNCGHADKADDDAGGNLLGGERMIMANLPPFSLSEERKTTSATSACPK